MPTIMSGSISILSDAGLGMAMFSLGTFFFFFYLIEFVKIYIWENFEIYSLEYICI